MRVLHNSEINTGDWRRFIKGNPFSSPFQTPEFHELINSCNNLTSDVIAVVSERDIEALCLITVQKEAGVRGFFSKRAIIYGGPVFNREEPESLRILLENIEREFLHRSIYTEIRNLNDYSSVSGIFEKNKWEYTPYLNIILDCTIKEKIYQGLSSNRKRQIKKAIASGAVTGEGRSISQIIEFYNILKDLYLRKIKKPLFHQMFFEEAFKQGFCRFQLVFYEEKVIGGIMFPVWHDACVYEFYVCGLDEEYRNQYPSILATWALMEWAADNGIKTFDFMGAGIKGKDYGVREFKERFGGKLVEYGRYLKINKPVLYKTGKGALGLIKALKK